jgi:hypothetical protein
MYKEILMATLLELSGTQFERGIFEIRLERKVPGWMKVFLTLGQINGRFVAIGFFLFSGFLTYKNVIARWVLEKGWVLDPTSALRIQETLTWTLMIVGLVFYGFALLIRQEKLVLAFDKHSNSLRFRHLSKFARRPEREGLIPFSDIHKIELSGPKVTLETRFPTKAYQKFEFRLLTDEQKKFFPLNLSRITGLEPTGDWVDPDSESLQKPTNLS